MPSISVIIAAIDDDRSNDRTSAHADELAAGNHPIGVLQIR